MATLIWLRNDLRLHDHEPLSVAAEAGGPVILVYCFDPRQFGQTAFGFPKTGPFRAEFLRQSVADLRRSLQGLGSDLVIRQGKPEQVIPALAQEWGCDQVLWHEEATAEELRVEAALGEALGARGIAWETYWGATLYHPDELPFSLARLPDVFTQFRKQVEAEVQPYDPLPAPKTLPPLPAGLDPGSLPELATWGLTLPPADDRAVLAFEGGETAALARLKHYFWQGDHLQHYKETRNGLLGPDYSSKFSPWLALGCLSPRLIYQEVQRYELKRVKNDSTYWLIFELLWRDYFRFVAMKYGNRLFQAAGIQGTALPWVQDWPRFQAWCDGETGFPLVDANMRELRATGFMSNRGRQNVASFLTKNLGIDWRMGAEWFESWLIDYDVCSNWGNWNYTAGVGNDARGFRYFNIPKQAQDYDPQGAYAQHWIPALAVLPPNLVHRVDRLTAEEQGRYGLRLGVDYPKPIVDLQKSVQVQEARYRQALGLPPGGDRPNPRDRPRRRR